MLTIKEKLRYLENTSANADVQKTAAKETQQKSNLGLVKAENQHGPFFLREKTFPLDFSHGGCTLNDYFRISHKDIEYINNRKIESVIDPKHFLFFDSETTGLAGGSGTYAFLCGFGYFDNDSFVVKQFFMREHQHEYAYLYEIQKLLKQFNGITSFNGKSYDIPLLKTRFILNRIDLPIDEIEHIDLLHTARRLWKKTIGPCSLGNIEKSILGFSRQNDVEGANVPKLFFNYLKNGDEESIKPVFKHNVIDILSMVAIIVASSNAFQSFIPTRHTNITTADSIALARAFSTFNNIDGMQKLLNGPLEHKSPELLMEISLYLKRYKKLDQAVILWEHLVTRSDYNEFAYTELAKYWEHTSNNYSKALDIVDRAIKREAIRKELGLQVENSMFKEDWQHRKKRLLQKIRKSNNENK